MTADILPFPNRRSEADMVFITKAAAAAHLGVGERTLDRLRERGLPAHRVKSRLYFRRAELDAWSRGRRT